MTSVTPSIYQALAIKHGLKFYRQHGGKINRAYTPMAMMRMASKITGQTFKSRDYATAEQALTLWIEAQRNG